MNRINPNLNRLGGESLNNLGGSFNPFSAMGNPGGSRDSYPNVLSQTKPGMEMPLGAPASSAQSQGYNIHANSKFYYPKDAEFLSNDYMSKPGAKFNANKNAVLIKDDKQNNIDPNLEEVEYHNEASEEPQEIRESRHAGAKHSLKPSL